MNHGNNVRGGWDIEGTQAHRKQIVLELELLCLDLVGDCFDEGTLFHLEEGLAFYALMIGISAELGGSEVVNIKPIVIPDCPQFCKIELPAEVSVGQVGETGEGEVVAALDDGLAVAPQHKSTFSGVPDSELFGAADYGEEVAVPDEDTGFGGAHEDAAVLAVVDVDSGIGIEEEDVAFLAV